MANYNPSNSMRFRTKFVMTAVFFILFAAVAINFFRISVLNNDKYQAMANDQHFGSITISAHRGSIYDANGAALAKSASVYKVFLDLHAIERILKNFSRESTKEMRIRRMETISLRMMRTAMN